MTGDVAYGQKAENGLDELKKRLKDGQTGGAFLLWGVEEYTKDHYAEKLRKIGKDAPVPDFNYTVFDAETREADGFAEEVLAPPYLWEKRVVELQGVSQSRRGKLKQSDAEKYVHALEELPDYTTVLLVLRAGEKEKSRDKGLEGLRTLVDGFAKNGLSVEFGQPRASQLYAWISRHFAANKTNISDDLPRAMVDCCGTDLYTLQGEITKLCAVAGERTLEAADVRTYCCPNESGVFFEVADRILAGDLAGAVHTLAVLKLDRSGVQLAIGYLASSYRLLLLADAARTRGVPQSRVAKERNLQSWQVSRAFANLSKVSREGIRRSLGEIAETDAAVKTGRADPVLALELLVTKLAALAGTAG